MSTEITDEMVERAARASYAAWVARAQALHGLYPPAWDAALTYHRDAHAEQARAALTAALSPAPQAPAGEAEREAVNELAAVLEAACWQGSFHQLARAAVTAGWLSPSHARKQEARIARMEAERTRALALLAQARAVLASVDAKHPGGLAGQIVSRIDNETVARVFAALAEGGRDNG